jgi:hypothetical protein
MCTNASKRGGAMAEIPAGMNFMSPIGARRTATRLPSPRPKSLEGKVIGFLDNHKFSVKEFFGRVEPALVDRFKAGGTTYRQKPNTSEGAPFLDQMAKECQVVVNAIGD